MGKVVRAFHRGGIVNISEIKYANWKVKVVKEDVTRKVVRDQIMTVSC